MVSMMAPSLVAIYVITVKSFRDRHAHIESLSKRLGFEFQYVWKYDADQLSELDLPMVSDSLAPKSASNVLKHIEAQKMFIDSSGSEGFALILEDDVVLFDNFLSRLESIIARAKLLPPGFLIFLGGADNKIDKRFLSLSGDDLVESPITTAEAYLVDRYGCEKRLQWVEENKLTKQADHQLKQIDCELGLVQYRVAKALATQGSITGMFKTALDESRAKHSSLYLRFRFVWNQFRRQTLPRLLYRVCRVFDK